jgi:hypothetical protein
MDSGGRRSPRPQKLVQMATCSWINMARSPQLLLLLLLLLLPPPGVAMSSPAPAGAQRPHIVFVVRHALHAHVYSRVPPGCPPAHRARRARCHSVLRTDAASPRLSGECFSFTLDFRPDNIWVIQSSELLSSRQFEC